MDGLIEFFVSINKIALIAFFAVFCFLIFEIKKTIDDKKKKEKPVVPQFNNTVQVNAPVAANNTPLPAQVPIKKNVKEGNPYLMIVIASVSLIGVTVLIYFSYTINQQKQKVAATSVPIIKEVSSAGLMVYDSKWKEIGSDKKNQAKYGDKIIIGIQTIVEADIDRARIKINSKDWQISDITTLFNPSLKVYYKEYVVATGTAQLKIEAQLHSASDGWLGD